MATVLKVTFDGEMRRMRIKKDATSLQRSDVDDAVRELFGISAYAATFQDSTGEWTKLTEESLSDLTNACEGVLRLRVEVPALSSTSELAAASPRSSVASEATSSLNSWMKVEADEPEFQVFDLINEEEDDAEESATEWDRLSHLSELQDYANIPAASEQLSAATTRDGESAHEELLGAAEQRSSLNERMLQHMEDVGSRAPSPHSSTGMRSVQNERFVEEVALTDACSTVDSFDAASSVGEHMREDVALDESVRSMFESASERGDNDDTELNIPQTVPTYSIHTPRIGSTVSSVTDPEEEREEHDEEEDAASIAERLNGAPEQRLVCNEEKIALIVAAFDRNGDGHLDFHECNALLKCAGAKAIFVHQYLSLCRKLGERMSAGFGPASLTTLYAESGHLERDFEAAIQKLSGELRASNHGRPASSGCKAGRCAMAPLLGLMAVPIVAPLALSALPLALPVAAAVALKSKCRS